MSTVFQLEKMVCYLHKMDIKLEIWSGSVNGAGKQDFYWVSLRPSTEIDSWLLKLLIGVTKRKSLVMPMLVLVSADQFCILHVEKSFYSDAVKLWCSY